MFEVHIAYFVRWMRENERTYEREKERQSTTFFSLPFSFCIRSSTFMSNHERVYANKHTFESYTDKNHGVR